MKLSIAKWLRPEGSIDSDPASSWTINLPCEGVSKTDPAPGWAFIHLGGILVTCQLDNFLRDAYICMVERHPCTPKPPTPWANLLPGPPATTSLVVSMSMGARVGVVTTDGLLFGSPTL